MTNATAPQILDPVADDAATMNGWSDRNPATIVKRTAKTIWVQADRTSHMSGPDHDAYANGAGQVVVFERDYDAPICRYSLRTNGRWIQAGASLRGPSLAVGRRSYYRDPSF